MNLKEEFLKNCLVLDVEATGPDYKTAEIIELAFCVRENRDWEIFEELHKPYEGITPEISAITTITNRMVENSTYFNDSLAEFNSLLDKLHEDGFCVSHNIKYDKKILEINGIHKKNWICTFRMAKKLFHDDETVIMLGLQYLRYRLDLKIPDNMQAHRAGSDAYVAAKLLEYLVDVLEDRGIIDPNVPYANQISTWLYEPILYETMPFGMHKGKRLEDIPIAYWHWALKNLDSLDETKETYDSDFADSVAMAIEKIIQT